MAETSEPFRYVLNKIKALKTQEEDALVRLQTKEPAPPGLVSVIKKDLDIPAGAIKEDMPFSQQVFLVGTGVTRGKKQ